MKLLVFACFAQIRAYAERKKDGLLAMACKDVPFFVEAYIRNHDLLKTCNYGIRLNLLCGLLAVNRVACLELKKGDIIKVIETPLAKEDRHI